jgi:phosphoribosylanthranilate isomerase
MIRVKICGMASLEDVAICAGAGADALGFIFARSPRSLSPEDAQRLIERVPPFVTTVGVFANDAADAVRDAVAR